MTSIYYLGIKEFNIKEEVYVTLRQFFYPTGKNKWENMYEMSTLETLLEFPKIKNKINSKGTTEYALAGKTADDIKLLIDNNTKQVLIYINNSLYDTLYFFYGNLKQEDVEAKMKNGLLSIKLNVKEVVEKKVPLIEVKVKDE